MQSFPVRERGLKPAVTDEASAKTLLSFPVRERGLKLTEIKAAVNEFRSFPVRERGLKRYKRHHKPIPVTVVPRAGTWIETTKTAVTAKASPSSFPVRERGLKHYNRTTMRKTILRRSPCGNVD